MTISVEHPVPISLFGPCRRWLASLRRWVSTHVAGTPHPEISMLLVPPCLDWSNLSVSSDMYHHLSSFIIIHHHLSSFIRTYHHLSEFINRDVHIDWYRFLLICAFKVWRTGGSKWTIFIGQTPEDWHGLTFRGPGWLYTPGLWLICPSTVPSVSLLGHCDMINKRC